MARVNSEIERLKMGNKSSFDRKWEMQIMYAGEKLLNLCLYLCVFFIALIVLQLFCLTSFKIPSDSMKPALSAGDQIVVNKLIRGARLFDVMKALSHEDIDIYRMPALGKLKRNDVLVFNFPYPGGRWDSISFDVMKYYVKRCVALPGDTLEIKEGFFKVRGIKEKLGNLSAQKYISGLTKNMDNGVVLQAFPQDNKINWTIQEFGPLAIPCRGQIVDLNSSTALIYKQLIGWEQKKKVRIEGEEIFIGDSLAHEYQFKENYYFVAGDRTENSQDSRYWGMLPEPFIVGKATFIWKSVDSMTGDIRWNRMFKRVI